MLLVMGRLKNLICQVSNGESTCLKEKGGFCLLARPCEYYSSLWLFSFKAQFSNTYENYIRIPLATFAANYEPEGGVCAIFVEYLPKGTSQGRSIIFGGMFF
jgi:hypothetical protein